MKKKTFQAFGEEHGTKKTSHQKCKSLSFLRDTKMHKVPQGGFFRRVVALRQSILKKSSVQFYRHCQEGIAVFRMWGNNYVWTERVGGRAMFPEMWQVTAKLTKHLHPWSEIVSTSYLTAYSRVFYSKNPHTRTPIFGVQADWVLIYRVFQVKSAWKCSKVFLIFYF